MGSAISDGGEMCIRDRFREIGGLPTLSIQANYEKVVKWNLGLSREELRTVNDAGFYVLARPSNYEKVTSDDIRAVFTRLEGARISSVVFAGQEILGHPDRLEETCLLYTSYIRGGHVYSLQHVPLGRLVKLRGRVIWLRK